VVVAVVAVWVVQVTIHQIVGVVAVRDGLVATPLAVDVVRVVAAAVMVGRAGSRVAVRDLDDVLIDMVTMGMVQVPIMQVVDVPIVLDGLMAAPWSVNVVVRFVDIASRHWDPLHGLIRGVLLRRDRTY
jgi:hypothetical protein